MRFTQMKKIVGLLFTLSFLFSASSAHAAVSITTATGGTNISADKAANATSPAFTTLGNIVITETANNDISANGTFTVQPPAGWNFNTTGVTASATNSLTATVTSQTASLLTITIGGRSNSKIQSFTIIGLQVRSTNGGALPSAGNITRAGGTATVSGITNSSTNLGSLSQTAGNAIKLAFSTQPIGTTYGSLLGTQPVVKSQDQFSSPSSTGLGASKTVTLTLSSGTGTLQGTVVLDIGTSAGNGTATYTNITVGGVGAVGSGKAFTATATGLTGAISSSFTMNARAAALTGTRVYDTTTTATFGILSVSNKVGSDDVTVTSGSGTLTSANAGVESISSLGTLALGGASASNYTLTGASGTVTVTKATPTLFVTNSPVTYTGSGQSATVSGSVPGTASAILTGGAATQTAAGTYAVTANFAPADSTNYNSLTAAAAGDFVITKATPTLSVTNSPVTYNATPQSATVVGSVPGSVSNIKYAGSATVPTDVGTYAITADFTPVDSTNYLSLTGAAAGDFVIAGSSQTITFDTLSDKTYGDADFLVSASASSGLAVSFASQTAGVCSVNIATVHILSIGTCAVRASQAGDSNYSAAPNVDQSFSIATKSLTVSGITANDKVYDGNTTATLNVGGAALVGVVSGDAVTLNTGSAVGTFASPNPGTGITVAVSGLTVSGAAAPNYALTEPSTAATINSPTPTTTSIVPIQIAVGSSGFTMTVNGTNFVASSTVLFDGSIRSTTFASSTMLTAQILASDLIAVSTSTIAVVNVAPGGGTSNAQVFTVFTPIDVTAPTVTAFAIATSSTSLTVSVPTFTATDNVGVTGYILAEASTTPSLGDTGWSATAPSNYIFSTQGDKTLYAWAKDAAGNISTSLNATTTIALPDDTIPVVTAFTIPAATSSLSVTITTFTATDNVGVAGYLITEASTTPSLGNTGWSLTPQSTYTFAYQGNKTLYAWAKDAAGNISIGVSAPTSISFVEISPTGMPSLITLGAVDPNGPAASSTQVTFNQEVHVVFGGGTNIIIPFNSVLSATSTVDWTSLSGQLSVATGDLPSTYSVVGTLQWGLQGTPLALSQDATVKIAVDSSHNGETLTVFKKEAGGATWLQSTTCVVAAGFCQFTTNSFSSFIVAFLKAVITAGAPQGSAVAPTKVNFSGQAYPGSKVQVYFKSNADSLYRAAPQGVYTVSADGTFDVTYIGLYGGDYIFGLQAEDKEGLKSGIVQATVNLLSADKLIVNNIFLPPTLGFFRTAVRAGDFVTAAGEAAAGSTVELEIDGKIQPQTVKAGADGSYKILVGTAPLALGTHSARVHQKSEGRISDFSSSKTFTVSKVFFPVTDLNNDGKINITDWSIFLSLWTSKDEVARKRIDFNGDGKVDLADFSIFMQSLRQQ